MSSRKKSKLTTQQKQAIKDFNSHWSFQFLYVDDIEKGTMTFDEAWQKSIDWLQDRVTETVHMYSKYMDVERDQE